MKTLSALQMKFLWLAALVFFALGLLVTRGRVGIDFKIFYAGGEVARQHADVYNQAIQDKIVIPHSGCYYFRAAQELWAFEPLSRLPEETAFLIWDFLMLGCIVVSALLLRREYPEFPLIAVFALPFPMAMMNLGQDSGIIFLITVVAFLCFRRDRDFLAGLVLSAALIKPQFAIPLIAVVGPRHWKALLGFGVGSAMYLAQTVAMVGIHGIREMTALGRIQDRWEGNILSRNTNLHGLIGNHPAMVIGVSVALIVWGMFRKSGREEAFCAGIMVCQLVSYHGHLCDMLPLIIPIAWLWKEGIGLWLVLSSALLFRLVMAIPGSPFQLYAILVLVTLGTITFKKKASSGALEAAVAS